LDISRASDFPDSYKGFSQVKITKHVLEMRLREGAMIQRHFTMMMASYEKYAIGLEALLLSRAYDRDRLKLALAQTFANHVKEYFTIDGAEDHTYREEFRAVFCADWRKDFAEFERLLDSLDYPPLDESFSVEMVEHIHREMEATAT